MVTINYNLRHKIFHGLKAIVFVIASSLYGLLGYYISNRWEIGLTVFLTVFIYFCKDLDEESEDYEKQMNLLRSISKILDFMEEKIDGFMEELNKKIFSVYDLDEIDYNFYLLNINPSIDWIKTENIIDKIYKIREKISLVNQYNRELRNGATFKIYFEEIFRLTNEDLIPPIENVRDYIKKWGLEKGYGRKNISYSPNPSILQSLSV